MFYISAKILKFLHSGSLHPAKCLLGLFLKPFLSNCLELLETIAIYALEACPGLQNDPFAKNPIAGGEVG